MKERIERMKQRNANARESVERAERCLKANPIDKNGAAMFLDEAQSIVGLLQLEIDGLKQVEMDDELFEEFKSLIASNASLSFRICNLRSKLR